MGARSQRNVTHLSEQPRLLRTQARLEIVTQISMKYLKSPSPISRYHTPPIISVIEGQGLVLAQLSLTLKYRAAIILNLITHITGNSKFLSKKLLILSIEHI